MGQVAAATTADLHLPALSPAATGKKKGRKTAASSGGMLGKLGLKKGRAERAEEEAPGAGTAGSPRYIQVGLVRLCNRQLCLAYSMLPACMACVSPCWLTF